MATLDKQAINAERELASVALDKTKRKAESVEVAVPPTEQSEIDAHMLTHLPCAAWCPACVMAKGRPGVHQSDPSRAQRRELPIISWDFCFTGKTCEQVAEDSQQSKLTCLVLHDSHTVHCVPVHHKGQTKYMCQEILRFITFLGHGEVTIRCDQEHSGSACASRSAREVTRQRGDEQEAEERRSQRRLQTKQGWEDWEESQGKKR